MQQASKSISNSIHGENLNQLCHIPLCNFIQ